MGIVSIEDELHEQLRRASKVSCRSINAQAAFWIRIGMLCELNPHLTYQQVMLRELREAGVDPAEAHALPPAPPVPAAPLRADIAAE
ncbi:MAG: ParD-like family protein [Sphingobium sp.]